MSERGLTVQECGACGHRQHPPRALCTGCGSTEALGDLPVTGAGTVDAVTVVMRAPGPVDQQAHEPPYALARVRLAEGPIVLTHVVADDPHAVAIGDEVTLDRRTELPVFRPARSPQEMP